MKLQFSSGNKIDLRNSGREYFPAVLAALARARQEVFLEAYIFVLDDTGYAIVESLCTAAARGVNVHVLVDGFGSRDLPGLIVERFAQSGVRLLRYRPPVIWRPVRGLRRMHRKIVVIDGGMEQAATSVPAGAPAVSTSVAFVGGINVIDDWNAPHEVPPRLDFAVEVRGPLVRDIHVAARHLWMVAAMAAMSGLRVRREGSRQVGAAVACGDALAALAVRDNLRHRTDIEDAYLGAIRRAHTDVLVASGYFLPSRRFVRELRAAVLRGVTVTILMQGPSDHPVMQAATQSLYRLLIDAGIVIVEYRKSFLHAKVAVVDDAWATVGSSNIDPFSLLLSREANVVVSHPPFAAQLRAALREAIATGGVTVTLEDLGRTPWYRRLGQWLAYRLARTTVDLVAPARRRSIV